MMVIDGGCFVQGGSDREVCREVIRQIKMRPIIGAVKWNERFVNHKGKEVFAYRSGEDFSSYLFCWRKGGVCPSLHDHPRHFYVCKIRMVPAGGMKGGLRFRFERPLLWVPGHSS